MATEQSDALQQLLWLSYGLSGMCVLFGAWRSAVLSFLFFTVGFFLTGHEIFPLFWTPFTHNLLAPVVYWADSLQGNPWVSWADSPRDAGAALFVIFGCIPVMAASIGVFTRKMRAGEPVQPQVQCPFYRGKEQDYQTHTADVRHTRYSVDTEDNLADEILF